MAVGNPRRLKIYNPSQVVGSKQLSYGFASNLGDASPKASFIGFTGTPIEKTDANTRADFDNYVSLYDIQRVVADKATVPIYFESRISKLSLNAIEFPIGPRETSCRSHRPASRSSRSF